MEVKVKAQYLLLIFIVANSKSYILLQISRVIVTIVSIIWNESNKPNNDDIEIKMPILFATTGFQSCCFWYLLRYQKWSHKLSFLCKYLSVAILLVVWCEIIMTPIEIIFATLFILHQHFWWITFVTFGNELYRHVKHEHFSRYVIKSQWG